MMVCCAESSNPDYSKILSISSASDKFTIFIFSLFFSPFLSFSILDRFQINLNYNVILPTALSCQLNVCRHRRRSCLPLLLFSGSIFMGTWGYCAWLYFSFLVRSSFYDVLFRLFPVGTRDWRVLPSSTLMVGWSVPLFSRTVQLSLYCQHQKLQVMKSLFHLYLRNRSHVVLLLNSGLASLPFLVNDGYDKPSKCWRSLYVVGRTWGEVEACLV